MELTKEIKEILENLVYWDSCPKDYKDKINAYLKSVNESEALSIHDVSEMFKFAGYLYGNFDYYDNTEDGDIYIHNDNGLKYTREKVYQQWIGIRNSR